MAQTPNDETTDEPALANAARQTYDKVKEGIKDEAHRAMSGARSQADSLAESQKTAGVDYLSSVTSAIQSGRRKLEKDGYESSAALVGHAAESVEGFAESLGEHDLGDLLREVEGFARERPALFYGAALVAGFAAARFLKTSPVEEEDEPAPRPARKRAAAAKSGRATASSKPRSRGSARGRKKAGS